MGKEKKAPKPGTQAAREADDLAKREDLKAKRAEEEAAEAAAADAEAQRLVDEAAAHQVELERALQVDREEKELLVAKMQAIHRGRTSRRATKDVAKSRHDDCHVRKAAHAKSTANPLSGGGYGDDMFETEIDKDLSSADDNIVAGRSLFCLGEGSGMRHEMNTILDNKYTQGFILVCILVNVVVLSVETPTAVLEDSTRDMLHLADLLLSIIFSIEMVMRVIALGLVMEPTAYLRTSWNVMDFVVVLSIWFGWIGQLMQPAGHAAEEGNISYLRTARALRPLRSLRMFGGIKKIMSSLYSAIPMVMNVTMLIMFFFVAFAAVGLSLYHGATTRACLDANTTLSIMQALPGFTAADRELFQWFPGRLSNMTYGVEYEDCPSSLICDGDEPGLCEKVQYEFTGDLPDEINSYGFDNFRNAIMTIFIATTLDEWPQISDPIRGAPLMAAWTAWGFFALVVLICGMLGTNLFVAVISFAFANVAETEDGTSAFAKGKVYTGDHDHDYDVPEAEEEEEDLDLMTMSPQVSVATFDTDEAAESTTFDAEDIGATDAKGGKRPKKPGVPAFRKIVVNGYFEGFILFIVVLNTAALGSEHYDPEFHDYGGMSETFKDRLHSIEIVFTGIYIVELIMKQLGLGPKEYFSSGFNCLDFILVCTTILSFAMKDLKGFGAGRMFRILRLFRAARLVKLMKRYYAVRKLLSTVSQSWEALLNVGFFVMVWLVIFAVMGIHLYGYDNEVFERDGLPRDNFHNFPRALLTSYVVLTGEDWSPLMYNYIRAFGWNAAVYFVFMFIMTNFVLTNLFVAVILENFSVAEDMKLEIQKRKYEADMKRRKKHGGALAFEDEPDDTPFIEDLCCPQQDLHYCPDHCFLRQWCSRIVEDDRFDHFIIVIILASSACLGVEGPPDAVYLQDQPGIRNILEFLDVTFFFIFWFECICKIVSSGFLLTRGAYLTDGWNKLDFTVVILTTVDFVMRYCSSCSGEYAWMKVFRVARVMRPLRVASKFDNIRVIVDALLSAVGGVIAVLALAAFLFLVFAVLGLNLFAGKFWMCQEEGFEMLNKTECAIAGYEWANPDQHFDNIWHAFEALFVTATLEGWVEIMNHAMDVPESIGMAPVESTFGQSFGHALYFVVFTILASFFITNLFIGVLVNNFQESTGSAVMTDEQQKWARFQMLLSMATIEKSEEELAAEMARASPIQQSLLPIVNDHKFEIAVSAMVGVNVFILLCEHFPQSQEFSEFVELVNLLFLIAFTVEAVTQIVARGPVAYLRSNWFKIDLFVISMSWILTFSDIQAGQNAARAVRMLRVLLILKFAKMARAMVMTVILSIGPAFNVIMVLLLVLYIYGVAGMQFYGNLEDCEKINDLENFRNIFMSMMFLFQISTGQDFKSIMFDIRAQDGFAVGAFFISFYIVSVFVMINLFVAVLLEAFEREFDDSVELDLTAEDLIEFKNSWDGKCQDLLNKELVMPKKGFCGVRSTRSSLPVRYLRDFISELPEESVVGRARDLPGNDGVWWNRLLYELSIQEKCTLHKVESSYIHEAEQGQVSDRVLDEQIEFDEAVRACNLMRTAAKGGDDADPLDQLSYGERVELQAQLDAKREHCAMELLRASVGAWRMLRYPPADVAEKIANDPTGNEKKTWNMQVVMARTLMITTVIQRTKIG